MERKFKVGDKVRIKNRAYFHSDLKNGDIGTITKVDVDYSRLSLKFGDLNQVIGFNLFDNYLELLKQSTKLIFRDNATILIKDGKRYITKCCEGGTYDREKGLLVCLAKASGYTFDDLQKMLEDAEEYGNAVKGVKREAKVGEYIKIVNCKDNRYKNGDKLKVIERVFMGVYAKTTKNETVSVYHSEYVVLENYKPKGAK